MNANKVIDKILSQAKSQAEAILKEASDKAAQQKASLDAELAEFEQKTAQLANAAAEDKRQRMLASARMANAKQLLAAKVGIVNDIFAKAKAAVNKLPDDQYLALMMSLIKQAVVTGQEEVIVGKNETRINDAFLKTVNAQIDGTIKKGNLKLSAKKGDFEGGFILVSGNVQINACTDMLIDRLRESMEMELSAELFS